MVVHSDDRQYSRELLVPIVLGVILTVAGLAILISPKLRGAREAKMIQSGEKLASRIIGSSYFSAV
jgi:hypothetical protein